jgi:hypothetical protein
MDALNNTITIAMTITITIAVTITVTIAVIISVTISVAFAVSIDVTTDLHLCLPCITNPLVDFNRVNFHLLILTGEFQLVHFIKVYSKWLH